MQATARRRATSSHSAAPGRPPPLADRSDPLHTPDGRYIVVRGRLWRAANPDLPSEERERHVNSLMNARRAVGAAMRAGDKDAELQARTQVHAAKIALGERGPVWWDDGAPDQNRKMVRNSSYADWWASHHGVKPV